MVKKYKKILSLFTVIIVLGLGILLINKGLIGNIFDNLIYGKGDNNMKDVTYKINISINGTNFTATLEENDTTKEFLKRLPLEINMKELNGNEKYYYFDESLPSNSTKVKKISSGDLMLYGDDCLVLFYESFNTPYSYTRIGKIDDISSLKNSVGKENIKVSITE